LRSPSPFFDPRKLPRHSKVSPLPKTSGLRCAKLLSPASWSPPTSRSRANLSGTPGSGPWVWEESLQMGLLPGCALQLAWDEEGSGLNDGAYGKS